jgi:hypothetical protein
VTRAPVVSRRPRRPLSPAPGKGRRRTFHSECSVRPADNRDRPAVAKGAAPALGSAPRAPPCTDRAASAGKERDRHEADRSDRPRPPREPRKDPLPGRNMAPADHTKSARQGKRPPRAGSRQSLLVATAAAPRRRPSCSRRRNNGHPARTSRRSRPAIAPWPCNGSLRKRPRRSNSPARSAGTLRARGSAPWRRCLAAPRPACHRPFRTRRSPRRHDAPAPSDGPRS